MYVNLITLNFNCFLSHFCIGMEGSCVGRIVLFLQQVAIKNVSGDTQKAFDYTDVILLTCKVSEIIPRV